MGFTIGLNSYKIDQTKEEFMDTNDQKMKMKIIWAAMLMSHIFFMLILIFVLPKDNVVNEISVSNINTIIFICLGVGLSLLSSAIYFKSLRQEYENNPVAQMNQKVLSYAVTESISIVGILSMVFFDLYQVAQLLIIIGMVSHLRKFPKQRKPTI